MAATLAAALRPKAAELVAVFTPTSLSALLNESRNLTNVTIEAMVAADRSIATSPELIRLMRIARSKRRDSTIAVHDRRVKSADTIYATATKVDTSAYVRNWPYCAAERSSLRFEPGLNVNPTRGA
ncbi:hypothetical protein RRF57_000238 [Xylaria bambusicola]|uniref:Uncharacterized protein n=1 Tax=Xylaria bambusicola TaxID=326684 RepID=A0AAN7UBT2_9PEZI